MAENWVGMVDLSSDEFDGPDRWHCEEGWKTFASIGMRRFQTANGTNGLEVAFVCLFDDEPADPSETDVGLEAGTTFWLTNRGMKPFVKLLRAIGPMTSFDPASDEQIGELLQAGYFRGRVQIETYEKNNGGEGTRANVAEFAPFDGDEDPSWSSLIEEAQRHYHERMVKLEEARTKRAEAAHEADQPRRRRRKADPSDVPF